MAAWDITGHAALRERVRVPIALDESIDSEGTARAALADGAADVLVVKPAASEVSRRRGGSWTLQPQPGHRSSWAHTSRPALGCRGSSHCGIAAGSGASGPTTNGAGARPRYLRRSGPRPAERAAADRQRRMGVPAAVTLEESEVDRTPRALQAQG